MSTYWSMYVVPDNWTLRDCLCVGYAWQAKFLMSNEEFKEFMEYEHKNSSRLYDELIKQPCLYEYTTDDGGDPDHKEIMHLLRPTGRLYRFPGRLSVLIPELDSFVKEHEGKRYICMN